MSGLGRFRDWLDALFAERHLYVRAGEDMKTYVLTPQKQLILAGAAALVVVWLGGATAAVLVNMAHTAALERETAVALTKYQSAVADRQAKLNSAVAQLDAANASSSELAAEVERRHAALAQLLTELRPVPGAAQALTPVIRQPLSAPAADPAGRVQKVIASQEHVLDAADRFAVEQKDRLRLAFQYAGLAPASYAPRGPRGGPSIEPRDPRALAAQLKVDEAFARRIQRTAEHLWEARALSEAVESLPLATPVDFGRETSGFGVRFDPFNGGLAFHSGVDFAGGWMAPVYATAPGVVAFTGRHGGYGNTVEIDHGRGFRTRYGHLAAIYVAPGEPVAAGQPVGGMGSTGRSTGTHLHYEVWVNGRPTDPNRFLRAGQFVYWGG